MKRHTAREKALQALFQMHISEVDPLEAIQNVLEEDEHVDDFLHQLVKGTSDNIEFIDSLIREHLEKWSMERIGNIDRAILRIAVYEMQFVEDIPRNVSINEAIELAKVFGDDDTSKFVNAVLSKVKNTLEKEKGEG